MRRPTVAHCREVGKALAALHLAGADFPLTRAERAWRIDGWRTLFGGLRASAPTRSSRGWPPRSRPTSPCSSSAGRRACRRA